MKEFFIHCQWAVMHLFRYKLAPQLVFEFGEPESDELSQGKGFVHSCC